MGRRDICVPAYVYLYGAVHVNSWQPAPHRNTHSTCRWEAIQHHLMLLPRPRIHAAAAMNAGNYVVLFFYPLGARAA